MRSWLLAFLLCACGGGSTNVPQDASTTDSGNNNGCGVSSVKGLEVAAAQGYNLFDPLGYPPVASEGCTLVYLASDGSLRARDLRTSKESTLADASDKPRRPTMSKGLIAWEAIENGTSVVRIRDDMTGSTSRLAGGFDHAGEPRATSDGVVFVGWMSADDASDTDIFVYERASKMVTPAIAAPGQQRFPDIDATRIAYSDFGEGGPTGAFSINQYAAADIVVFDRATKTKTSRPLMGKQAFPMLGPNGIVAYLDWGTIHPEPKFSEYRLKIGTGADTSADTEVATITNGVPYLRPSLRDGVFEWTSNGQLWRRPLSESLASRVAYDGMIYGVVPGDGLSILALAKTTTLSLDAVPR